MEMRFDGSGVIDDDGDSEDVDKIKLEYKKE